MSPKGVARVLWSVAATAAISFYIAVIIPERRALARVELQAQTLYEAADSDERVVSEEAKVISARAAITREIKSVTVGARAAVAMVEALAADSRRFGVKVVSVHPRAAASLPAVKRVEPLITTSLTVELQGEYASILRFIAEVSQTCPLLSIDGVTLRRELEPGNGVTLHATLDASAYELSANWEEIIDTYASAPR